MKNTGEIIRAVKNIKLQSQKRSLLVWVVLSLLFYWLVYTKSNNITITGITTNFIGQVQSRLLVIVFIDNIEAASTNSISSKIDGLQYSPVNMEREFNFSLTMPNDLNLRVQLANLSAYFPINELKQNNPIFIADRLSVIAVDPFQLPSRPLRLLPNGTIAAASGEDNKKSQEGRETRAATNNFILFFNSIIIGILTAISNIIINIISLQYEAKTKLQFLILKISVLIIIILIAILGRISVLP
jgi:hypothetical protein